jgi:hypothetical protein
MKLFNRIKFALKYDIERRFIVFDFKNQYFTTFMDYDEAKKSSVSQFEYCPKILVAVEKIR